MLILTFLVLGFLGTSRSTVAFHEIECEQDNDCPLNTFCYLRTNLCAPCNPNYCNRLNREDSKWRKCHKEVSDCGGCLEGHHEEILADGNARDACILSPVSKEHADSQATLMVDTEHINLGNRLISSLILSGVLLVGVILLVSLVYSRFRPVQWLLPGDSNTRPHEPVSIGLGHQIIPSHESAPPPSYCSSSSMPLLHTGECGNYCGQQVKQIADSSPSAPSVIESHSTLPDTIEGHVTFQKQHLLQANPFRDADYIQEDPLGTESIDENNSDEESIAGEIPGDFENPTFEDETTRPSDWTPVSRSEKDGTQDRPFKCFTRNHDESSD